MPGWGRTGELTSAETALMAKSVQIPAPIPPEMGLEAMKKTHKVYVPLADRPEKPEHRRNIDNFFGVILRDAGQGAIIDGDTKELISVVDTGHAVHIFRASATGRYFYTIGRDGKVSLIDLFAKKPQVVAEARVCLDARSVEVSKYKGPKGDFVDKLALVGCYWPPQMVVLDGRTLEPLKVISTRSSTYDSNEYHPEPRVATIIPRATTSGPMPRSPRMRAPTSRSAYFARISSTRGRSAGRRRSVDLCVGQEGRDHHLRRQDVEGEDSDPRRLDRHSHGQVEHAQYGV